MCGFIHDLYRIEKEARSADAKKRLKARRRYSRDIVEEIKVHADAIGMPGRTQWLFNDSQKEASASAFYYGLIQTAKANGHEPYRYLSYLFEWLPVKTLKSCTRCRRPVMW